MINWKIYFGAKNNNDIWSDPTYLVKITLIEEDPFEHPNFAP